MPLDRIFNDELMKKIKATDNSLFNALRKNKYRIEVNNWLINFGSKGWLKSLEKRLYRSTTWSSFYSKINELRAGYFFEHVLGFRLIQYEAPTENRKNVEFKGIKNKAEFFIEVKTPLVLEKQNGISGWDGDNEPLVYDCLDKAITQLPQNGNNIVVLSDDLNLPLLYDGTIISSIKVYLNLPESEKIGAVCILGNIFIEDMYKREFIVNPNARKPIQEFISVD